MTKIDPKKFWRNMMTTWKNISGPNHRAVIDHLTHLDSFAGGESGRWLTDDVEAGRRLEKAVKSNCDTQKDQIQKLLGTMNEVKANLTDASTANDIQEMQEGIIAYQNMMKKRFEDIKKQHGWK